MCRVTAVEPIRDGAIFWLVVRDVGVEQEQRDATDLQAALEEVIAEHVAR